MTNTTDIVFTQENVINLFTRHLRSLADSGDIAGTVAVWDVLSEFPKVIRDAVEEATA